MSAARDALFAEAMALRVSGLAVATAEGLDGRPCGLLLTSLCSYSAQPPSVLISVHVGTRSQLALERCRTFGVHLLGRDQEAVAWTFAQDGEAKFDAVAWAWDRGVPVLAGAIAYLRCSPCAGFHHGDHVIVIGELAEGHVQPGEPLCYSRRTMSWRLEPRAAAAGAPPPVRGQAPPVRGRRPSS